MRRFWSIGIETELFGGASCVRHWGRMGTRGNTTLLGCASPEDAERIVTMMIRRKLQRGYVELAG